MHLRRETAISARATGTFEITSSDEPYDEDAGAKLLRTRASKTFQGDFEGSASAELLKAIADVPGSAGYVGIERLTGTLHGRKGSFVLQHNGTMPRGVADLIVHVVPDSGSGELAGISGTMEIDIVDGQHTYTLDYDIQA